MGQQVEVAVARRHLETDTGRFVVLAEQNAVAQDAMDEIDGSPVQGDQLYRASHDALEVTLQVQRPTFQRLPGKLHEQHTNVDIAVRARRAAGLAAEQPRCRNPPTGGLEEATQVVEQVLGCL